MQPLTDTGASSTATADSESFLRLPPLLSKDFWRSVIHGRLDVAEPLTYSANINATEH